MRKHILICSILFFALLAAQACYGQSVSITSISPSSPTTLNFGEEVTINFKYTINRKGGFRIFIRPFTSGRLTPNYSASGSPIHTSSRGSGSSQFSIKKGNLVAVDQLRVQVVDSRRWSTIFEFFIPVEFTFGKVLTHMPVLSEVYSIPNVTANEMAVVTDDLKNIIPPDTTDKIFIERKTVKPDGTIEIYYSDGRVRGIITPSSGYSVDPVTRDTMFTELQFYSDVQGIHEPAEPPGLTASSPTSVDQAWLESLNKWIDYLGYQLLNEIKTALEEKAFDNYKTFESNNSSNIYQQVNLRYTFLEKLRLSDV